MRRCWGWWRGCWRERTRRMRLGITWRGSGAGWWGWRRCRRWESSFIPCGCGISHPPPQSPLSSTSVTSATINIVCCYIVIHVLIVCQVVSRSTMSASWLRRCFITISATVLWEFMRSSSRIWHLMRESLWLHRKSKTIAQLWYRDHGFVIFIFVVRVFINHIFTPTAHVQKSATICNQEISSTIVIIPFYIYIVME